MIAIDSVSRPSGPVANAAATIVVLGDLQALVHLHDTLGPSVSAGFMPEKVRAQFVSMAPGTLDGKAVVQCGADHSQAA
ncbi:MAG: hypothetical protein Q8L55_08150 [Phycisphaerales bacterium]|nr:hypothetical protein [Phycisphaerales bacterium]